MMGKIHLGDDGSESSDSLNVGNQFLDSGDAALLDFLDCRHHLPGVRSPGPGSTWRCSNSTLDPRIPGPKFIS